MGDLKAKYNPDVDDGGWNKENILKDIINHPEHYTGHPSGVECIDVVEHMNFCLGNAMKYIWRADSKGDPIENLEKAIWYLKREITRREDKEASGT